MDKILITANSISNNTLMNLENRDSALWVHITPTDPDQRAMIAAFISLPWRMVIFEGHDRELIQVLESSTNVNDDLARKRGFIQIIDSDPSRVELPPRCLPIYLLDGRHDDVRVSSFEKRLNRITMLEEFRRSSVRELVIMTQDSGPVPSDLSELWSAGYRSQLTFVTDLPRAETELKKWLDQTTNVITITLITLAPIEFVRDTLQRYYETYPLDRHIVRMHDSQGQVHKIDVTNADELERPLLESFTLIEERDLMLIGPEDLSQEEFISFFKNPELSWRPYAAGLPWIKSTRYKDMLGSSLHRLDEAGPEENCVGLIVSQPGAGGTTLARALAWTLAREGYPTLIAKPFPFVPDALPIVNYITRVQRMLVSETSESVATESVLEEQPTTNPSGGVLARHFETPWVLVFDTIHWQNRETELVQFLNEITRSGRPVFILIVTGPHIGLTFRNKALFKKIAELNHNIKYAEALALGRHLNNFLRNYGRERTESQWSQFYEEHTIRFDEGIAAFWVTLSFWIQGQYDLSESIQQWIYDAFKEHAEDNLIKDAIVQIAAMSSERLPLPQALLPEATGGWPVWQLLEDRSDDLASIGLSQFIADGVQYWTLVHDILGRLLINALFYDYAERANLGYADAIDTEHLRFLILQKISSNPSLNERTYRSLGEDFATEIFKVDPDHGKISFAPFWRQVLDALDHMPKLFRDTNRVFRHHSSISRRRIAKLEPAYYNVSPLDKTELLERAITDINFAIKEIPFSKGSEPDLNLLNSLAHAYFDLAEAKMETGAPGEEIAKLKKLANDATLRAYRESPSNSFTIETYVRSLLQNALDDPSQAMENCITALSTLYSTLHVGVDNSRPPQLEKLANKALEILIQQVPRDIIARSPRNTIEVLVQAWLTLAKDRSGERRWSITDVPKSYQEKALEILENPIIRGNLQALHLKYELICNCHPIDFRKQLEILEPIRISVQWISPQLELEYAILLFQVGRPKEGDRAFRSLRERWLTSEQFVQVPDRLRWLRAPDGRTPLIVHATKSSDLAMKAFAIVRELANVKVPFRPEEHGLNNPKPGLSFSCYISFGHNGPFLRPLSIQPPLFE